MKKKDRKAKLYLKIFGLVEEPVKKFSEDLCDSNIAYVFDDYDDFRQYFIDNNCSRAYDDKIINICIMKTTKKGTIIALKRLCDYTITRVNNIKVVTEDIEDKPKTKIK